MVLARNTRQQTIQEKVEGMNKDKKDAIDVKFT